ncbi:60S ribosomal protein L7a [Plecturocebus cupreus]
MHTIEARHRLAPESAIYTVCSCFIYLSAPKMLKGKQAKGKKVALTPAVVKKQEADKFNWEDRGALMKLLEAIRTNDNDRYYEICPHWEGNGLGPKSVPHIAKQEKAKAGTLATKLGWDQLSPTKRAPSPVYSARRSAALGRRQNSHAGQKSRAGDPCGSFAGNLPVCENQKFVCNCGIHSLCAFTVSYNPELLLPQRFPVQSIQDGRARLVPSPQGKQQSEAPRTESFTASTANPGGSSSVGKGHPPKEN